MFINFWYPALRSEDLADRQVSVRMLGQEVVLARDRNGRASCVAGTGPHRRGAPLPGRTRVDTYPVEERYGLIHVFLGDLPENARPGIMAIPEYGLPGWRFNIMVFDGACNYERSVENALDTAHTSFVHGFGGPREENELELVRHEWGSSFMTPFYDTPGMPSSFVPRAGSGFHGASCFYTNIEGRPDYIVNQYMFELPVDETHIRIFLVNSRNNRLDPSFDAPIVASCERVVREDLRVLENLRPVCTPRDPGREFLVIADKAVRDYRDWLAGWERRGWRIDTARLRAVRGHSAWAIPGPARRESDGWALERIPTVQPEAAA